MPSNWVVCWLEELDYSCNLTMRRASASSVIQFRVRVSLSALDFMKKMIRKYLLIALEAECVTRSLYQHNQSKRDLWMFSYNGWFNRHDNVYLCLLITCFLPRPLSQYTFIMHLTVFKCTNSYISRLALTQAPEKDWPNIGPPVCATVAQSCCTTMWQHWIYQSWPNIGQQSCCNVGAQSSSWLPLMAQQLGHSWPNYVPIMAQLCTNNGPTIMNYVPIMAQLCTNNGPTMYQ